MLRMISDAGKCPWLTVLFRSNFFCPIIPYIYMVLWVFNKRQKINRINTINITNITNIINIINIIN